MTEQELAAIAATMPPPAPGAEILPLNPHEQALANLDKTAPFVARMSEIAAGRAVVEEWEWQAVKPKPSDIYSGAACDPLWKLKPEVLEAMLKEGEIKFVGGKWYRRVPLRGRYPTHADSMKAFDLLAKLTGAYAAATAAVKAGYDETREARRLAVRYYDTIPVIVES